MPSDVEPMHAEMLGDPRDDNDDQNDDEYRNQKTDHDLSGRNDAAKAAIPINPRATSSAKCLRVNGAPAMNIKTAARTIMKMPPSKSMSFTIEPFV